jgi:pyridoxamine 5'-phosphate oxidase
MSCGGFEDLHADPVVQLAAWLEEARASGIREPSAMALATVRPDGAPDVRMVLLRGVAADGLRFYTDERSQKGQSIVRDPRAAVVFHWEAIERQVRAAGRIERLDRADSARYFGSRPRGSQLAAWASHQSAPIEDRAALERRYEAVRRDFGDGPIPLPPYWGGYVLVPERWEFWHSRADRLHDRIRYSPDHEGGWQRQRLMP